MTAVGSAQISASDYALAEIVGKANNVDPKLLIAIGLHETGWGTAGAGRAPSAGGAGDITGCGSVDSDPNNYGTGGLAGQLVCTARTLRGKNVTDLPTLLKYQQTNGRNAYGATDPNWTAGVANSYNEIKNTTFVGNSSTAYGGTYKAGDGSGRTVNGLQFVESLYGDAEGAAIPQGITGGLATGAVNDAKKALSAAELGAKILAELSKPSFWERVGYGAAGVVAIGVGAHLVFGISIPVGAIAEKVGEAAVAE